MSEQFHEEVVIKRNKGAENILFAFSAVVMIISGFYAFFTINMLITIIFSQGFSTVLLLDIIMALISLVACILLFIHRDKIRTEYEYTFTSGVLDFARVYNNKKRKNLGSMTLKNIEACGLVTSGSFKRYSSMPGVKMINWFLNRDSELFYLYFVKEGAKQIVVMEPSEKLIGLIKRSAGHGKYQIN